jgi:hypothetical protein
MSVTSTGARVVFRVNGQKVAFANAMNYTVSHGHQPVDVLDQLTPVEYAEVSYTVNFTCTMFRIANQSAISIGLRPKLQNILTQPELTAELIDRVNGQTLMLLERVKCTQEDMNIDARSLGQVTLSFVAIKMSDEAGA